MKCIDCQYYYDIKGHEYGPFKVGYCDKEPDDERSMDSDHMAVVCAHDGGITVGENFGCKHFKP